MFKDLRVDADTVLIQFILVGVGYTIEIDRTRYPLMAYVFRGTEIAPLLFLNKEEYDIFEIIYACFQAVEDDYNSGSNKK